MRLAMSVQFLVGMAIALAGCSKGNLESPAPLETARQAIIGGEVDELHPAVGRVISPTSSCTGTIISSQVVLTAAHCVNPDSPPVQFHLGHMGGAPEAILEVVDAKVHPAYDPLVGDAEGGKPNDIAVLLLAEPAPVPPIPFRTKPLDCLEGTPVLFVGYGLINSVDPASSGNKFKVEIPMGKIGESGFWTYSHPGAPKNACPGDSGGPALLTAGGKSEVVGIMSTADKYCEWQTFLVGVHLHTAWLYGQIEELDPAGLPTECGDGICEYLEDDETCPDDCAPGSGAGPGDSCEGDEVCPSNYICADLGEGKVCATWCAGPANGTGCPCGEHCVPYELEPGDGTGACKFSVAFEANCGDGACDAGESATSCPADCTQEGCGDILPVGCCSGEVAVRCEQGQLVLHDCSVEATCGWDLTDQLYKCDTSGDPSEEHEMACPELPPKCGNGLCEPLETADNCLADCIYDGFCGDGTCNGTEDYSRCPDDCKKDICAVLPDMGCCMGNVAVWCMLGDLQMFSCEHHPACGWNPDAGGYMCDTAGEEDPEGLFPMDCENYPAISCGDGKCNGEENWESCPDDCEAPLEGCGDGDCGSGEDFATCPQDCYQSGCDKIGREGCCDNGLVKWCEYGGLFLVNCTEEPSCGWSSDDGYYWCGTDGSADPSGTFLQSCEEVNSATCGNDHCGPEENEYTCPEDCAEAPLFECGNGECEVGENDETCPDDCLAIEPAPEPEPDAGSSADLLLLDVACGDCEGQESEQKDSGNSCTLAPSSSADTLVPLALLMIALVGLLQSRRRRTSSRQ
jgi:hypothetical protein